MKKIALIIIIAFNLSSVHGQFNYDSSKAETIRWTPIPEKIFGLGAHILELNGDWKFSIKPEQDFFKKENAQEWDDIEVPGEWVMQGFDVGKGEYAGYFKTFNVSPAWNNYSIKLKCEAIYSECSIWVNGKKVGSHLGGFTPFELDVTNLLTKGKNNIAIAVRSESLADTLSNASKYAVHPLGGITRPVYLMALPKVNLASFHVNTRFDENFEDADLNVEITVANESSKEKEARLKFTLKDSKGKVVSFEGVKNHKIVLAKAEKEKLATSFKVSNPLKWDCEHPNLYYLTCTVLLDGKEVKTITRRFGFRQIDVRGNQVYVNNHVIKLKGVCRHEIDPSRGRSLNKNQWYEDVKLFKEGNVNYIRTSHYPPNEKLLDACDELGMFVEEEAPFCWGSKVLVNDNNYFEAILQPTLEMVERDKSHPSIIHWSLANESHDFEELYKTSGDLVKEADPTRPRIFSQWGENSDGGYLELGNTHYPGPEGPKKFSKNKRPVIFDEYCHLNAYNRFELMTDPGLRDIWGRGFKMMWENMYKTPSVLGGALWAGIDDSFFLPSGEAVGYGTWGPIDSWRRKKPEFWHMKKVYSPVKIELLAGNDDELVNLLVENRYFFSNLSECTIKWHNGAQSGEIEAFIEPGNSMEIKLPFNRSELGKLTIDVFKDSNVPVDQYSFDLSSSKLEWKAKEDASFSWKEVNLIKIASSKNITVELSDSDLKIYGNNGEEILKSLPELMLIPLNGLGAGTQMTKETPEFDLYSPLAGNRNIENISVETSDSDIRISISDTYTEATGYTKIRIGANGTIQISYEYIIREELNLRQWGMVLKLSDQLQSLKWQKNGLWSVYPDNHIGRNQGMAKCFMGHSTSGLAGPKNKPSWSWSEDQTQYGTNDFRSTKRNIITASLLNDEKMGVEIHSGGLQHIRSWFDQATVNLLVLEYDNPGAERFFRNHANHWDKPLKSGDKISGTVNIEIKNK